MPCYSLRLTARRDLVAHFPYLSEVAAEKTARRFLTLAYETFEFLSETPLSGATRDFRNSRFEGVRMFPVHRFSKYLVFYRPRKHWITVLRVIHGNRNLRELFAPIDPS